MRRCAIALVVLSSALAACGYEMVRYSQALGDVQRVAIVGLENDTFEPGVDSLVSEALYREFMRRGALELVDDPRAADLVLSGTVRDIRTASRSFSSVSFSLEYQVAMAVEIVARRPDGTEILLDPGALQELDFYLASADVEAARTNREEALRRLASLIAGRVHDALYERVVP